MEAAVQAAVADVLSIPVAEATDALAIVTIALVGEAEIAVLNQRVVVVMNRTTEAVRQVVEAVRHLVVANQEVVLVAILADPEIN